MLKDRERFLLEGKLPWKQNSTTVVAAPTILVKKHVKYKYFEKNLDFETKPSSVTRTVCYNYNSWLTGVYMAYNFDKNSRGKAKWLFEQNLDPFAPLSILQRFGYLCALAAKATRLQELAGRFRPRLSPDTQNRAFAKNGSCIQILDTALDTT